MSAIFNEYTPPPGRMVCPSCEQPEGGGGWIVHKHGCQLGSLENRRRAVTAHTVAIEFPGPELAKAAWEAITEHANHNHRGRGETAGWYRIRSTTGAWFVVIVGESRPPLRQFTAIAHGYGGRVTRRPPPTMTAAAKTRRWRTIVDSAISGDHRNIEVRDTPSQVDTRGEVHRVTGGQG